jgi:hypothetical protein
MPSVLVWCDDEKQRCKQFPTACLEGNGMNRDRPVPRVAALAQMPGRSRHPDHTWFIQARTPFKKESRQSASPSYAIPESEPGAIAAV